MLRDGAAGRQLSALSVDSTEEHAMTRGAKVLLIGGTSHVGKSTLAKRLAAELEWAHLSTDQFARHPGRPWRDDRSNVPSDVTSYYSLKSPTELVESVLHHYEHNVWPIADAVVRSHLNNPFDSCLVLEGSAILPELVRASQFQHSRCVWLTATDQLLTERIRVSSEFDSRIGDEQALIEAFIERTLTFNETLARSVGRLGERSLDVSSLDVFDRLVSLANGGQG